MSKESSAYSSRCLISSQRSAGFKEGPFGTAHETNTPPISKRKSECRLSWDQDLFGPRDIHIVAANMEDLCSFGTHLAMATSIFRSAVQHPSRSCSAPGESTQKWRRHYRRLGPW